MTDYAKGRTDLIILFVKSYTRRVLIWKKYCEHKHMKLKMLILEVKTRWNSCYYMLNRAIEYKNVIHFFLLKFEKDFPKEDWPSETDWINCSMYKDFLQVFDEVTLAFSKVYSHTSNLIGLQLCQIIMQFQKYEGEKDYEIKYKRTITVMREKFMKYWAEFPLVFWYNNNFRF